MSEVDHDKDFRDFVDGCIDIFRKQLKLQEGIYDKSMEFEKRMDDFTHGLDRRVATLEKDLEGLMGSAEKMVDAELTLAQEIKILWKRAADVEDRLLSLQKGLGTLRSGK